VREDYLTRPANAGTFQSMVQLHFLHGKQRAQGLSVKLLRGCVSLFFRLSLTRCWSFGGFLCFLVGGLFGSGEEEGQTRQKRAFCCPHVVDLLLKED